ncbi:hypothetical protein NYQ43_04410 [Xanthomonas translucens pv. translucens]|uniref:hypothetical protein n=1 Tax=Xanthomonas TaxID=338 RepID=UPI00216AA732|nr:MULTISPECIES: hypothetical protein [Xanthomonas]MCS3747162.1 hypothetical protein [Xanthomonas sp. 3793]MCT8284956.1 hypothetical protein [Xanthomonas translucens pv. translucens]MCT8302614.1 hypothetical protein [Xanthomonas translucens pv. translucens]
MKVEQFWNKAFLAALTRLPADEAKAEADKATELCIGHWQSQSRNWAPEYLVAWKDQKLSLVPNTNKNDPW